MFPRHRCAGKATQSVCDLLVHMLPFAACRHEIAQNKSKVHSILFWNDASKIKTLIASPHAEPVAFFPQTVCPQRGDLTVAVKPVLDKGAHSGARHFSGKLPYEVALVKSWHAFRLRRHKVCVPVLGRGFFSVYLRNYEVALVMPLVNFHIKWALWNVAVHFDCGGSHKVCVRVLGSFWDAAFFLHISV